MEPFGSNLSARSLIQTKYSLVILKKDEKVSEAISKLGYWKISSAPVVSEKQKLSGLVDMLDLLTFAGGKMAFKNPDPTSSRKAANEFLNKTVGDLIDVSGRDELYLIYDNSPFQEVINMLSKPNIHRVIVKNEEDKCEGIITQLDIIRFLGKHKKEFASILDKRIKDIWKIGEKKVETINYDNFVITALVQLIEKEISGLAVVNTQGQIVGNLSASDLKRMDVSNPAQLTYDIYESIKIFMNIEGKEKQLPKGRLPTFDPIFVKSENTLGEMIDIVITKGVHRVFVVDDNKRPVLEISLCDIIQQIKTQGSQ